MSQLVMLSWILLSMVDFNCVPNLNTPHLQTKEQTGGGRHPIPTYKLSEDPSTNRVDERSDAITLSVVELERKDIQRSPGHMSNRKTTKSSTHQK